MHGVLALGDSITNGGPGSRPWAEWLAEALGLRLTNLAFDGATAADVVREQLPAIRGGRYEVGCVYIGVNDARSVGWDALAYERDLATILRALRARCGRALVATLPLRLGLPPAGADLPLVNAAIARLAREHAATLVDLSDFAGARWVWADRVHASEAGQVEIADRAARALGVRRLPSQIAGLPRPTAAYRWAFARSAAREHARAAWLRARHRLARP